MQTQVSQDQSYEQGGNAEPICADGELFCGVSGVASNFLELPINTAGLRVMGEAGFNELELLEAGALEVVPSDSLDLATAWGRGRPSNEFLGFDHEGESELGFEAFDGSPVSAQNSDRIGHDDSRLVKFDIRADNEEPNQDVDGSQTEDETRQVVPGLSRNRTDQSKQGHDADADSGVEADLRSNSSHEVHYPHREASQAQQMREEN